MPDEPLGNPSPPQFTLRGMFVVMAVVALLLGILLPALRGARDRTWRTQCENSLKQLALAMHCYLDRYRSFAPAYVADENGKPLCSWRALSLPYLEAKSSCRFHFDEPWDSPYNLGFSKLRIDSFLCPADPSVALNGTNYVMIVGRGMLSDGKSATKPQEITDGMSNTIMFVETTGAKIPWAAPRDLEADKITFEINSPKTLGISSEHSGGANCAFCDGSVSFLADSTAPALVRAMCTISGGEEELRRDDEK